MNTFITRLIRSILYLLGIRLVNQFPPVMAKYPKYYQTKLFSCCLGRFILHGDTTDEFPHLTYIIGRGRGYTNSLCIVLRWPSRNYRRKMGGWWHSWIGRNRCWQNHNTPIFSISWSIAPRQSRLFKWFEHDAQFSTRGFNVRLFINNSCQFNRGLHWGAWLPIIVDRYRTWQWNRKHGESCLCAECCAERGDNNIMYQAQYQYDCGYKD